MLVESNLKSRAMMRTRKGIKNKVYLIGKRLLDLIISFILLLFAMPALLFISYWVYKREGAPILHKQQQMGKHHQPFIMWSFRTLTNTSQMIRSLPPYPVPASWEEGVSDNFTIIPNQQQTITQTGQTLRKYHIDKLPQLFNVLKGEMSLVGPEAETPEVTMYYNDDQMKRLAVRPGVIGYAQLKNKYNDQHDEKIIHDLYYIKHGTFKLDLKIMMHTIKKQLPQRRRD
ncbi:MAG TPA: sugar transferase [Virgibacillus sp.]|nr:sugar transferase [Virgibacillus sp.]